MSTKRVCQLDQNGFFLWMTDADESPLEPGVWALPGGAVDIGTEPVTQPGFRAKWNGSGFDLVAVESEPAQEPQSLADRRSAVWSQVKAIRQEKAERGGFRAAGKWFHSDVYSRTQQLGLIIAAQQFVAGGGQAYDPIPGVPMWSTLDNSKITLTPAVVAQFLPAFSAQEGSMFAYAESLRALIEASDNPESIDITAGWPSTFQTKNINTAAADVLEEIQGIGPAIAQDIIDGRPWASVQSLASLPAISESSLAVWEGQLSI